LKIFLNINDKQDFEEQLMVESVGPETNSDKFLSSDRFFNRELSWLAFNQRVLEEARNIKYPLLERLRFISISSSNMDEFYMVRVAGLKGMVSEGISNMSPDGLSPSKQLEAIIPAINKLASIQQESFKEIKEELRNKNFFIINSKELLSNEKVWLSNYFRDQIFPILTPLAVDPAHPFPFFANGSACLVLRIKPLDSGDDMEALIPLPIQLERFLRLPGNTSRYIALEEVILQFVDQMFPEFKVIGQGIFRLLRDSELEVDDEAEDLMLSFETALRRRRRGEVIQVVVDDKMPSDLRDFVTSKLDCATEDIFAVSLVGLHDLSQIITDARPDLLWRPFNARFPERIRDFGGDCMAAIRAKDIIVHHPYESFDVVIQFLKQAAIDSSVVAIKQTLYRTSKNSPIVSALIEAAESGKSVTAMIELKARFDEAANMNFARDLERAGVQVVYGFLDLKTHAKVSLIVRREGNTLRNYAHFGTGNYHPITAKVYTDLSFFTCDVAMCRDAARMFNYMTGYAKPVKLEKIFMSPLSSREKISKLIKSEINFALAGKPAAIWAKMNSLVDPDLINLFYKASNAGVKINFIIRGICCLRPGIEGLSRNITVKSIVGRFLEHSRVICFGNSEGLPSDKALIYISSADLMPRNLDRRVEHFIPIENQTVRRQVMEEIMVSNLKDDTNSWELREDGNYIRVIEAEEPFSAYKYFMTNPSLSGMGSGMKKEFYPRLVPLEE
jgi:polyphosphate kinase